MSLVLVTFLYAAWASVFSLGKVALQYSSPAFLTSFRMLLASVLILGFLAIWKRSALRIRLIQIFSLALLGFFSVYLTNIFEFWGLQHLTAGKACFIYGLSPFFALLFSYLHFKEKMNKRKWMGMVILLLSMIPVLWIQTGSEELLHAFSIFSWPALSLMAAALCSVYGWVLLRAAVKDAEISPLTANGVSMLFGGLMALGHSFLFDSWQPTPVEASEWSPFLKMTLAITCISNILCYNLYGMLLKRFTATFLSFMGLLTPIFASVHGWIFLREPISWGHFRFNSDSFLRIMDCLFRRIKAGLYRKTASIKNRSRYVNVMKIISLSTILTAALLIQGCSAVKSDISFRKGTEKLWNGDTEQAIAYLEEAIKLDPTIARNHHHLALAYQRVGQINLAWQHIRHAYALDSKSQAHLQVFNRLYQQISDQNRLQTKHPKAAEVVDILGVADQYLHDEKGELQAIYYGPLCLRFSEGLLTTAEFQRY